MDSIATVPDMGYLQVIVILLAAAVVVVALFKKLHLSPALGYLAAGVVIGPSGFSIVKDVAGTLSIAELGVVFLLFLIGLELSLGRLKAMRRHVFGLGSLQMLLTGGLIALLVAQLGHTPATAIIIGFGFAMSSTALVLKVIAETGEKSTQVGRLTLAILLMQDLAVVPLLVLVPLLASETQSIGMAIGNATIRAVLALIIVFVLGRIILRPIFRFIAAFNSPELFTALTLLIVLGISYAMYSQGLSLALGAFAAGLLVAETEYKHQVEADIMPYKGLLLGLFFMAVGMSINLPLVLEKYPLILALCFMLMVGKAAIIMALARVFGFSKGTSLQTGMVLSQGGEFGFILFQLAASKDHALIDVNTAQILLVVITISMAFTPLFAKLGKIWAQKLDTMKTVRVEDATAEVLDIKDHVVVLGYGRVGQTIGKLLDAEQIPYVAIDGNSAIASTGRKAGLPVYYGDGTRREILLGMGIDRARSVAITVNDFDSARRMLASVRALNKEIPVVARTKDLKEVHRLENEGANIAISEMFEASIELGAALLRQTGIIDTEVARITNVFRDKDYALARQSVEMRAADQPNAPKLEIFAFRKARVYHSIGTQKDNKK